MSENPGDQRAMSYLPDTHLHRLMLQAVQHRDEDAASGCRAVEAEEANTFACRLADELARRKRERAVMEPFELDVVGIVGLSEPDAGDGRI